MSSGNDQTIEGFFESVKEQAASSEQEAKKQAEQGLFDEYFDLLRESGLREVDFSEPFLYEEAPEAARPLIQEEIDKIDLQDESTIATIGQNVYPDLSRITARITSAVLYRNYDSSYGKDVTDAEIEEKISGVFSRLKAEDLADALMGEETGQETAKVQGWRRLFAWANNDSKEQAQLSLAERVRLFSNSLPGICSEIQRQKSDVTRQLGNVTELYKPVKDMVLEQSKALAKLEIVYAAAEYVHRTSSPEEARSERIIDKMVAQEQVQNKELLGNRVADLRTQYTAMMLTVCQSATMYRGLHLLKQQYQDIHDHAFPIWDGNLKAMAQLSRVAEQIARSQEKTADQSHEVSRLKQQLKQSKPGL